jgi:phosphonate dehydrogenase
MSRPVVVVTNWVHPDVLAPLAARFEVIANPDRVPWPPAVLRRHVGGADAMVAFMPDRVDAVFLAAAPRLQIVACALKGFDNFDIQACARRGVRVTIVEDLLTTPTAELAIGLMISLGRFLTEADADLRVAGFHGWRPRFYGTGLAGRVVGFVGMGAIGKAIAARLKPFEVRQLYYDARPLDAAAEAALGLERAGLADLLAAADFVVLAVPLTAATTHLIDDARLAAMKPGAFLVNPARGSLVDEEAVGRALLSGRLAGYAADAFESEDWARDDRPRDIHPSLLAKGVRTVLTPHLGSAVDDVRRRIAAAACDSVIDHFEGRIPKGTVEIAQDGGTPGDA